MSLEQFVQWSSPLAVYHWKAAPAIRKCLDFLVLGKRPPALLQKQFGPVVFNQANVWLEKYKAKELGFIKKGKWTHVWVYTRKGMRTNPAFMLYAEVMPYIWKDKPRLAILKLISLLQERDIQKNQEVIDSLVSWLHGKDKRSAWDLIQPIVDRDIPERPSAVAYRSEIDRRFNKDFPYQEITIKHWYTKLEQDDEGIHPVLYSHLINWDDRDPLVEYEFQQREDKQKIRLRQVLNLA